MDQKKCETTQNNRRKSKTLLKRVRIDPVCKGYTKTRIISKNKKSKLRMMHKANKDSSQMAVHSSSQSQMIIHESNNIHRLLPSNPIIHQDQFSTLYVPMPVSKNENVQYEDFSLNRPQNTQSTSQQTIRIKQEPESDNESDINNDITEEYGHYDPFIVRIVPDYSEEMEENVQYEDFSLNRPQNTQSTSQQPIRIKQEPESDNESDINNDITEEYGHYDPFIVRVVPDYSEEMEENVQYEDCSLNRPQNTKSTSQQTISIKQEPESDNESDINNDITEEYGHYDPFIVRVVPDYSEEMEENVQYEDCSLNRPQNTKSTSQQTIRIKQEPESDNESDINNDITEEYGHYDPFIVRVVPDYSEEMEENVQYEDFSLNRPQNTQSTSQQPIRIKQEPESDNESDINNDITEEYGHYDPFIVRVVPDYSEEMEENVQYEDCSLNRPQNTKSTSQQTISIKQEPESDNESDINNDITEEYGHYDPFIVRVVPDYSEEMEENVQYEDCSLNRPQNTKSTSQQTIRIKQEPESDNESDINNDITEEYGHYDPFIVRVVPDYSEEMEENVQYEDFSLNRPQNTQSTSQQPIRIKQEPESDNEPDTNTRSIHESYDYGRFIGDKIQAFSEKTKEAVQFELFKIICRAHRGYYK